MKEILKKWHRDLNEIYEEEESERRSFEGIYMGGLKDEDDDNDDEAFVTPPVSFKSSDEFELELPKLESDKEELIKELESKKAEIQKVNKYNQDLTQDLKNLRSEIDVLRDMENSKREDYEYLENEYEEQKKKIEKLGLGKMQLETRIQELKKEHENKTKEMKKGYETSLNELSETIKGLREDYEKKIRELKNMTNNLREESRQKDSQIREKNNQIRELNKGMEMGNATTAQLQEDLNRFKELYFKLKNEEGRAKEKIQQLEWNVQDQSNKTSEIGELKEYIQKIEPQLIN